MQVQLLECCMKNKQLTAADRKAIEVLLSTDHTKKKDCKGTRKGLHHNLQGDRKEW